MAPILVMPALAMRSIAPIHSSRSGLIGFLTRTITSTPLNASEISCTVKGFTDVLAPIHNMSIPNFNASYTCFSFATSVPTSRPVSCFTLLSHFSPSVPTPSNEFGRVLGFHIPARNRLTSFILANCVAVSITCSSVSALHGPEIRKGLPLYPLQS